MRNATGTVRRYRDTSDVVDHIRRQAETVVRNVNAGTSYTSEQFRVKAREVGEAMVKKLCENFTAAGRNDLARKIERTWEARPWMA